MPAEEPIGRVNAVIYARVSSKEQEREGFSIPAQLDLLRNYARQQGMVVLQEFVESESAREGGRTQFGNMLAFLKKSRNRCHTILVEKTDRLYRNIGDYASVDDSGVTIHFVKEASVLSPNSRSSDQLIHGIKVLMARNYSQNLGEETLKGMLQKAKSGLYPSCAPAGYRNSEGPDQKRIIVPNSDGQPSRGCLRSLPQGVIRSRPLPLSPGRKAGRLEDGRCTRARCIRSFESASTLGTSTGTAWPITAGMKRLLAVKLGRECRPYSITAFKPNSTGSSTISRLPGWSAVITAAAV